MLASTYDPKTVETDTYAFWQKHGLFAPEVHPDATETFSLVIPPPNVTGTLHMGHALDCTLQDILVRWKRMRGLQALWVPGTDHAGIATQNVVEKQLREQGQSRHDLGRDAFLNKVWDWAHGRQADIAGQLQRLGISPDWSRQRFTLDDGCSQAVRQAFVTLYDQKLIYKGARIVNWCPRCVSAISDIETDYMDEDSYLWEIAYKLSDGQALVVATTRPETLFGDVAVAVHPEDERYKAYIGQTVSLPLTGKAIPVIADDYVEKDFGTGVLKITPAHDANDFEVGQRHRLEPVWIIDDNGRMMASEDVSEALYGLDRFEARQQTEQLLDAAGLLISKKAHPHRVGHCQRCATTIEPMLSKQWFVKTQPLADQCLVALEKGDIRFIPERWTKDYIRWMTNIQDWCISRQLWWGHRIPAWTCDACGQVMVKAEPPTSCEVCASGQLTQETDVLDTWFSSGLWPFSTMGWPDTQARDYQRFFPTDVLVTGFDIIFFWVARMTMMSHGLTGKSPFHTVYIHGLIRDEKGQKMSKSKGNTVDPVLTIDEIGCDAFRFALTSLVTYGGQDIKLAKDKFEVGRLFANKLWNASRFVMMNLDGVDAVPPMAQTPMDAWILGRYHQVCEAADSALTEFRFGELAGDLYEFTWNAFCDWYVEMAKPQVRDDVTRGNTQRVLLLILDGLLRLWHPIMPFITEAIWQQLPHRQGLSISVAPYPLPDPLHASDESASVDFALETVRAIRNVRQSFGVAHSVAVPVLLEAPDPVERQALEHNRSLLERFIKLTDLTIAEKLENAPEQCAANLVGTTRVLIPLAGLIDVAAEQARITKKTDVLQKEQTQLNGLLNNQGFLAKASPEVVAKNQVRLAEVTTQLEILSQQAGALT